MNKEFLSQSNHKKCTFSIQVLNASGYFDSISQLGISMITIYELTYRIVEPDIQPDKDST